jgi:DNA repair protein RecN (Recombination protein N)
VATLTALHNACQLLQHQEKIEPCFKAFTEVLSSSLAQVEDTVHSLRAYLHRGEPDPQRLHELDERITSWLTLARRYKRPAVELPNLLMGWMQELQQLEAATHLEDIEALQASAYEAYLQEARQVSKCRAQAAPQLARAITLAMQGLGMQGGQFEVELLTSAQPTQSGLEDVGFLVAGHAGSSPRPMHKAASGGELSRIALAIAVTTSALGSAQTLIFDEVDAGVGGAVAETVGRQLKRLGVDRQVLAVTHLPQVAACADHHLMVSKQLVGESTVSLVTAVAGEQRVAELARMLAGERLLNSTLTHAREMLQDLG